MKQVRTSAYNYNFNEQNGYFERWGKTLEENSQYSPLGNEILDIQISNICHNGCNFCYQGNTSSGKNMSFDVFKNVVNKMSGNLTQIAIATGDIDSNPDIWKMMEYAYSIGIIPNITISGYRLTDDIISKLKKYVGGIAVSHYNDDICFDAVYKLHKAGLKQINIHQLLSEETYISTLNLLDSYKTDKRLSGLNAIVFMTLKQKGRGINYHRLLDHHYNLIINRCLSGNISIGFDSCGCSRFVNAIRGRNNFSNLLQYCEFCEATLFSAFINVNGLYFPCSFAEGKFDGIDVIKYENFLQDVWYNPITIDWRKKLLKNCRDCPVYEV